MLQKLFSTAPASPEEIDSPYALARMAICLMLGTVGAVGMWGIVVVMPAMQAEFGVDRGAVSLPYTATMIGFGIGNIVIGRLVDRRNTALPVAAAAVLLGFSFIGASLFPSLWLLHIFQFLIGFGSSATFAPLLADISHWFVRRRGIAVASVACGNYLGGALWPLIMQPLLAHGDWRFTYLTIGAICLATMLPLSLALRRPSPRGSFAAAGTGLPAAGTMSAGLSPRSLQWLLVLAGIGCCVAMSMPQIHIVSYCVDLGYGVVNGSQMLSLMAGAGIVSRLGSGLLADKIGGVRTLLIGSVGQGITLLLFIPFDGLVSLYLVSFLFGLSQGGIVPSYAIIVREYLPAHEAGQRVGIVIMATIGGMALGGWMSGAIYDMTGSYAAAFLNGIGWNVLNLTIMSFILWRSRPRAPSMVAAQ